MSALLFREDPYLRSCEATVVAVHGDAVELDRTVFYPLGGGQAGDTGRLGEWRVVDARKGPAGESVLHMLQPGAQVAIGDKVEAQIDWQRRHRLMRSPRTRRTSTSTSIWHAWWHRQSSDG